MTSGNFKLIPISSITIAPERQRADLGDVEGLAQSLANDGQINPILITPDRVLVAGERRLTAARLLGWDLIQAQLTTDLPPDALHKLELEENVRRKDLEWKEKCTAITEYHELCARQQKGWTYEQTAAALNITASAVSQNISVTAALREGVELVVSADKFSVARGIVTRNAERAAAAEMQSIDELLEPTPRTSANSVSSNLPTREVSTAGSEDVDADERPSANDGRLICADFLTWIDEPRTKQYNFIHCDFPYGINAGKHDGSAADKFGGYEDSPDIYFTLLNRFCNHLEEFVTPSAHIFFWFSMDYYNETLSALRSAGLTVNPFPCIWYKVDNSGILPDPRRGPRRNYETAFVATRGDRPIVQAVSNVAAVPNKKSIHMSEKPKAMLAHFFRMFVDEHSTVFDPTAGSANALKVAEAMGAKSVFGLERDPEYHARALENWNDD